MTGLATDHYDWAGGREAMLRFGRPDWPTVVVAQPLFEEANRTRRLIATVLRLLATDGIGGALPDLPGTGDSLVATVDARLDHWRSAFASACARVEAPVRVLAIRGGTLIDAAARAPRFHFAPVSGADLVRDLLRARRAAALAAGDVVRADDPRVPGPPLHLAGNHIDRTLLKALMDAEPGTADRAYTLFAAHGSPHPTLPATTRVALWRASEPGDDPALARSLADAILDWFRG
ncbi:hypothetical protein [Sphingomonas sp.]|uniref:hypothetical protein n=1 Tax=Sphingomonas sp. TaxID=28214 RepID=UPI00258C8156|nr:hypothetical protein [Sphingomonas sp.]